MPSTRDAVNNNEYRCAPVTALIELASNPRRRFRLGDDRPAIDLPTDFSSLLLD